MHYRQTLQSNQKESDKQPTPTGFFCKCLISKGNSWTTWRWSCICRRGLAGYKWSSILWTERSGLQKGKLCSPAAGTTVLTETIKAWSEVESSWIMSYWVVLIEGVSWNCTGIHLPHCEILKHYLGRCWKQLGEGAHSRAEASILHAGLASQCESRLTARTVYNALVAFSEFNITPYSLMCSKKSCRCQVTYNRFVPKITFSGL